MTSPRTYVAAGAAVCVVAGLVLWPERQPDPDVLDNIYCGAEAVALAEYLEQQQDVDPEVLAQSAAYAAQGQDYFEGLRRRTDRHAVMVGAEINGVRQTRDASLEQNAAAYIEEALARSEACIPRLSGVSSS